MSSRYISETIADQAILLEAQRILAVNGENGLTMDRLANTSGVSRATIYRRFGGRKGILQRIAAETGATFTELSEETNIPNRILQATLSTISKTGSLNITMEQVAAEAELGVATLYRHFGNKENLLQNMANHFHPRRTALELLSHISGDLEADLYQYTLAMLEIFQNQGNIFKMILMGDQKTQQLFKAVRPNQERTLNSLTRFFETYIQNGQIPSQDPFDLATAFLGLNIGFVLVRSTYTFSADDPDKIARRIVSIFLSGVQKGTL